MNSWEYIGIGIAISSAVITAHAFIMKIVIKSAISESLVNTYEKFVTKEHLEDHERKCPHQFKALKKS